MTFRHYEGNRAKVLAREFESRHCRCEALKAENVVACDGCLTPGGDAREYVRAVFAGYAHRFSGRYDNYDELQSHLHFLYQLRQQAGAEEWPVAPEPIHEEPISEVSLRLRHLFVVGAMVFFSTWMFVRSIALSISQ